MNKSSIVFSLWLVMGMLTIVLVILAIMGNSVSVVIIGTILGILLLAQVFTIAKMPDEVVFEPDGQGLDRLHCDECRSTRVVMSSLIEIDPDVKENKFGYKDLVIGTFWCTDCGYEFRQKGQITFE